MARLSAEQRNFLARNNISLDALFDASGLRKCEYSQIMKDNGKQFAYGVKECKRGHTLRSRSGGCIQCNTASIAYVKRHSSSGYLYIAGSKTEKLIKIGISSDPQNRLYIANLRGQNYAGASDWEMLFYIYVARAGEIENYIHDQLKDFNVHICFIRNGIEQVAKECFKCSYQQARFQIQLLLIINGIESFQGWERSDDALSQYEFHLIQH